jgi:hypothetical protein
LRGLDLNQRPLGYEPNELPDCSTSRYALIIARPWRAALQKPEETRIWATVLIRQEDECQAQLELFKNAPTKNPVELLQQGF